MQHDIYSLGVVLLELGLWTSFITYPPSSPTASPSQGPKDQAIEEDKKKDATNSITDPNPDPDTAIPPPFIDSQLSEKDARKRAVAIKTHLIHLTSEILPARMGNKYTDIVLLCLRCLDKTEKEEEGVGGEFSDVYDEDGIVVGVKYIEKILLRMQEISV
jgi:hypothetical protein